MAADSIEVAVVDPLDTWGTAIRVRLPSADDDAIVQELVNTIQEFAQKSGALPVRLTQDFVPGQAQYDFSLIPTTYTPAAAAFGGLRGLYCHAVQLPDGRYIPLVQNRPGPAYASPAQRGVPQAAFVPTWPGTVELFPAPDDSLAGQKLAVWTSVAFIRPVSSVLQLLSDFSYEAVLDGATARMMNHPKRPYSDTKLAEYYLRRFRNAMRVATDEAKRHWSNADTEFSFNPDWSSKT